MTSGALTYTSRTFGLATGLNTSLTVFLGPGTSLLQGKSTTYSVSAYVLSLGITFSKNLNDGFLGVTAATIGVGTGLKVGATVNETETVLHTEGPYASRETAGHRAADASPTQEKRSDRGFQGFFRVGGRLSSEQLQHDLEK